MGKNAEVERIAWGKRDAMIAECSVQEFYTGAWLVQPIGAGMWDAEGYATESEAREAAEYFAHLYGDCPVTRV